MMAPEPLTVLTAALIAGAGLYLGVVAWLLVGIRRSRRSRQVSTRIPSVSVVVAARDEERHISACLLALKRQDYEGPLQVVVVDDRSEDDTAAVVERVRGAWDADSELVLVEAPDPPRYAGPKKSALATGIGIASGEILMFTDADCEPPSGWVRALAARFVDEVGLVAGYAYTDPLRRHRHRVLEVDNLGVSALAEGSIGMGSPLSCTGRSLAYRRALYDEVGGFDAIGHLVSGDDVYFLRLVARTHWRVVYCADPATAVPSAPGPTSWRGLLDQKVRHASKAARYDGGARWLGVGVYGFHAALFAGWMQLATINTWNRVFLACWLLRWLADLALLWRFAPRGARDRSALVFLPIAEILYIPYVLFFVPLGRAGWFRWKGREAAFASPHPSRT